MISAESVTIDSTTTALVFVLGAPGAGKGTLCKRLAEDYGLRHLSVGDILRHTVSSPNADKIITECVQRGELVPTELLLSVLKTRIEESSEGDAILLDGFPRRLDQARSFEEIFGSPQLVLFFDCPKILAGERVTLRMVGREGDDRETFERRYKEFIELNPRILEYYVDKAKLVKVDTSGDSNTSYAHLLDVLRTRSEWEALTAAY